MSSLRHVCDYSLLHLRRRVKKEEEKNQHVVIIYDSLHGYESIVHLLEKDVGTTIEHGS